MLAKVRNGYGFHKGQLDYRSGDTVELTDVEYKSLSHIFESVVDSPEKKYETVTDTPGDVLENRAILDSEAGKPIVRRGTRKRA